ncbi:MAG: GTP-binding protein [archaeon]|nr:GTP-binding protein [archaeon]
MSNDTQQEKPSIEQPRCSFNILVLGESSVGKTCFLTRFSEGKFLGGHSATIGIDAQTKNVKLKDGTNVRIVIWDTAGQERYRTITKNYYNKADGIILMYDITEPSTFEQVDYWISEIKKNAKESISMCLVGNKIDLEDKREVSKEDGEKMAKKYKVPFYEASAYSDINVIDCFMNLAEEMNIKLGKIKQQKHKTVLKGETKGEKKKRKCCK